MQYSEKLNGFWEEGYHYYLEIRDERLIVRDYRRSIILKTEISYDADALERGMPLLISLRDNVLSRSYDGEMMSKIRELKYEDGELRLHYHYTIMGDTLYTLKKVDHGPFDHILIRDGEFLPFLQGEWVEWSRNGKGSKLYIKGNRLTWFTEKNVPFHVVSYRYSPDRAEIVPEDLTGSNFRGFTGISVEKDMLTTRMIVMDASVPLTVFARADMLDKIAVPDAALGSIRSTMMSPLYNPENGLFTPEPADRDPEAEKTGPAEVPDGDGFCPFCGLRLPPDHGKFCPLCGTRL